MHKETSRIRQHGGQAFVHREYHTSESDSCAVPYTLLTLPPNGNLCSCPHQCHSAPLFRRPSPASRSLLYHASTISCAKQSTLDPQKPPKPRPTPASSNREKQSVRNVHIPNHKRLATNTKPNFVALNCIRTPQIRKTRIATLEETAGIARSIKQTPQRYKSLHSLHRLPPTTDGQSARRWAGPL